MKNALITTCWGEKFGVRADWAQAASQVEMLDCDGRWVGTQYQVANFQHDPAAALRRALEECAEAGGEYDANESAEIDNAIEEAEWAD